MANTSDLCRDSGILDTTTNWFHYVQPEQNLGPEIVIGNWNLSMVDRNRQQLQRNKRIKTSKKILQDI